MPGEFHPTRYELLQALASSFGLQIMGFQTMQPASDFYISALHIIAHIPCSGRYISEPRSFESPPERTAHSAEEAAALMALRFYFGNQSISALDLLYRSSLTAHQHAHEYQQDNENMTTLVQKLQGLNTLLEQKFGFLRAELQSMVCDQRSAINRNPNILPLTINCP